MSTSVFFDKQDTTKHLRLPLYFRLLRRWEITRVEVAAKLLSPGKSLLDIGCGDGGLLRRAADRFQTFVGTDVAPVVLEKARLHPENAVLLDRVRWQQMNANEPLSFADASFSAVTCVSTLQYIVDPEAFLLEVQRILEPDGQLVIEVPNMAYLPQRLRLLVGKPIKTSFYPHGIDGGNLHYFTVTTIKQLLRAAGFAVRRVTGSGVFAPWRTWWVRLLCGDIIIRAEKASCTSQER